VNDTSLTSTVDAAELVKLCATDNDLFARAFFPKAARSRSPPFHKEIDEALDSPTSRRVNLRCFRGSAKTTKLRLFTGKRVAYAISHTILYVGASEGHSIRTIQWLRKAITITGERDGDLTLFAKTFDLRPGIKWTETEIEIKHGIDARDIWIQGVGITGNIRGINFDDYRPDLIVLDDIITDENAATKEQREKITDLVLGAVANSLTPASEEPNAKLALLQTPMHPEDVSSLAAKSEAWDTRSFGCWTRETQDFPVDEQRSVWEERYPTADLRKDKRDAAAQNKLSTWLREMECRLTSPETCAFKSEWLHYYEEAPLGGQTVLAIDPVPPPSDRALARRFVGSDYEAHAVWRRVGGNYYLIEYTLHRGHEPNWSVANALALARTHRVSRIVVESVGYQRTLKWLIQQEMTRRGTYWPITDLGEKQQRNKFLRITGALAGVASNGHMYVHANHADFIQQFSDYRNIGGEQADDLLDASATAVSDLISPLLEMGYDDDADAWDDSAIPKIRSRREACP
jgi:predicted phage terminase large subunit-like protein